MGLFTWLGNRKRPMVSVLRLNGVIGQLGPFRTGLTAQGLDQAIQRAFAPKRLAAVALIINSPGGSPVQSGLIATRIRAAAEKRNVPVLAFAEDVAASGGYWLACAADEIFVDENSIIGSIGVISSGFGFAEAIARLGIERRLYTAGDRKSLLDSFLPERPEDVARLKRLQGDIHTSFKAMVSKRRGNRLKGEESELFSGEFWIGPRAVALGLADGIGELRATMKERFGDKVRLKLIPPDRVGWRRRLGLAHGAETRGWPGEILAVLEERALWSRFGL
jgi:signal peptide peptidase SppA